MKQLKRDNKFNQLQRLLNEVAYTDRDALIAYAIEKKGFTYEEIGDVIGVTRQRVQQIHKRYLENPRCPKCGEPVKEEGLCPKCI